MASDAAIRTWDRAFSHPGWLGPYTLGEVLTKHDSTPHTNAPFRAIYVGGTGDVAVKIGNQTSAVVLSAVPAGTLLPLLVTQLMSTNTTATLVVGLK